MTLTTHHASGGFDHLGQWVEWKARCDLDGDDQPHDFQIEEVIVDGEELETDALPQELAKAIKDNSWSAEWER